LGAVALTPSAYAGTKDDDWARCIWKQAPTSASNWINMEESDGDPLESEDSYGLLATRLQGFCREAMILAGKKYPPDFKPKAVRKALVATKPTSISDDVGKSDAYRCRIYEDDVPLGLTLGFGDPSKLKPRAPATSIKCQIITDKGALADV